MNLLKTIIERLNQRVEVSNIFDQIYPLCELNANGNEKAWVHYIGNGQAEVVTNFDAKQGTLFWAKRGKVSVTKTESLKVSGCKTLYLTSFPLTAYAVVRKSHLPCDSEDSQDWIASRIYRLISGTDPDFKVSIGVIQYEVIPNGYVNEIKSLTANYEWACVAVDVDVSVVSSSEDGCYDVCATGDIPLPDFQPCTPCLTEVAVDGVTIIGNGTTDDPLVAIGGGGGGGVMTAIAFSTDHLSSTGNQYVVGNVVWYNGNIYRCIANNDSILPTNTTYGTNLGAGFQTIERPIDWDATSGNNQILNKPTIPILPSSIVEDVTATAPLSSSGGTTPDISITQADGTTDGYLSSTDWNTFDGKFNVPTGLSTDYLDGLGSPQPFPSIPTGTVTSVGTTGLISGGPITTSGTITTSMNTAKLVGRYSAGTGIMEEITVGSGLTLTGAGVLNNTSTPTPTGYYGAFQDNTTQTAVSANTAYAVKLNTTDLTNGVSVVNDGSGNPTRITLANTGIYNIQFSLQLEKTGGSGNFTVDVWVRKNGVDIPNTTGKVVLTGSANASPVVAAWNYVLDLAANDYVQLMWSTSNNNSIILAAVATPPHPGIPSAILTVTQQAGIMAGTGITAINSLTGAAQSLVVGTSGTDFAISSASATHTFNLPTASASNRGALSSADWTTFNAKQNAITPAALTKTDDTNVTLTLGGSPSTSLLAATSLTLGWSGTLADSRIASAATWNAKQDALVSGTNIKTINSTSLLGSGNISIGVPLIYKNTTDQTAVTGVTTNVKVVSQLIPANTFATGDIIQIKSRIGKTGVGGLVTLRSYINTADSLTSPAPILITTATTANVNQNYMGIDRSAIIKSSTITQTANAASSILLDASSLQGALTNSNINWTVDQYIIFAIQNNAAGDSTVLSYYQIEKQ